MVMAMVSCPTCHAAIATDDLNMKEGVALCRACDRMWRLGEIAHDPEDAAADEVSEETPPSGCELNDLGNAVVIRAACRGGSGLFFLFFTLFWNSIVSVFVLLAVGSLYTHIVGPLPSWFPFTGTSGKGKSANNMPLGMTIGLCVFLIPFVLVGVGTAMAAVLGLAGHYRVTLRGVEGEAFTGVGPIGWTRRFDASTVKSVKIKYADSETNDKPNKEIVIDADRTVKFGVMLTERRRQWMVGVVRRLLMPGAARGTRAGRRS